MALRIEIEMEGRGQLLEDSYEKHSSGVQKLQGENYFSFMKGLQKDIGIQEEEAMIIRKV